MSRLLKASEATETKTPPRLARTEVTSAFLVPRSLPPCRSAPTKEPSSAAGACALALPESALAFRGCSACYDGRLRDAATGVAGVGMLVVGAVRSPLGRGLGLRGHCGGLRGLRQVRRRDQLLPDRGERPPC